MNKIPLVARIIFGLVFFASGLAGLLNLMQPPPDLSADMQTFMAGMMAAKYFFPLLKVTETVCGLMVLTGLFVPLALVILAPIVINIFLVHLFLQPSGLPIALVLGLLEIYLAFFVSPYKEPIRRLFSKRL